MPTSILRVCLVTESAWTFSIGQPSLAESPNQGFRALSSVPLWWKSESETIRDQKKTENLVLIYMFIQSTWKKDENGLNLFAPQEEWNGSYHKKLRWKRPTNPRTSRCSRYLVAGKKSWSFVPAQFLNADLQKPSIQNLFSCAPTKMAGAVNKIGNQIETTPQTELTSKKIWCSLHFPWWWNPIFPDSARHNLFINCPKIRYHHPILNCL